MGLDITFDVVDNKCLTQEELELRNEFDSFHKTDQTYELQYYGKSYYYVYRFLIDQIEARHNFKYERGFVRVEREDIKGFILNHLDLDEKQNLEVLALFMCILEQFDFETQTLVLSASY